MSTIRPLATIAILASLGIFLAKQINAPKEDADQLTANWGEAPAYDANAEPAAPGYQSESLAPPLAGPPITASSHAGPSIDVPPIAPPAPATTSPMASGPGGDLPPLPSLPSDPGTPLAAPAMPGGPAMPPVMNDLSQDIPLPDTIVEATPEGIPADQLPNNPLAGLPTGPPAEASRYGAGPAGAPPLMDNASPEADPYQSYTPAVPPAAEAPAPQSDPNSYTTLGNIPGPTEPTFRDALPAINQALERNELTRAHTLLSSWYGDPSLSPVERDKVYALLSQLAGTVVYSTEHRMEPPYTVKSGDTLKTIAQEYQVPWRLLAKINGVPSSQAIQAGQTLKVMRGPFGAVLDAKSSELVLMIDGKYAGKFPVQLSGAAVQEGAWRVTQKPDGSPSPLGGAGSKQLVLSDASGMANLIIATGSGSPIERGRVTVAAGDLEELHDILSVGSEVKIRR